MGLDFSDLHTGKKSLISENNFCFLIEKLTQGTFFNVSQLLIFTLARLHHYLSDQYSFCSEYVTAYLSSEPNQT